MQATISLNRGKHFAVELLTTKDVQLLISKCSGRCPTGIRNKALLAVLYRSGLRVSESLALKTQDVDLEAGTINVQCGKGSKQRIAGIDEWGLNFLRTWVLERGLQGISPRSPLFCTLSGQRISTAYVRSLMKRLARKSSIDKRCNPHSFRHSFSSELRQEGIDIGVISKQLGHSSIATTARYLDHISPVQVVAAIKNRVVAV